MEMAIRRWSPARAAGTVALGIFQHERPWPAPIAALDRMSGGAIAALVASRDFSGRWSELAVSDPDPARENAREAERGARWGEAVCVARDLAATPGQDLTPDMLAARAREIAKASGAAVEVLGVPQLERLGMGALLAVGRG